MVGHCNLAVKNCDQIMNICHVIMDHYDGNVNHCYKEYDFIPL